MDTWLTVTEIVAATGLPARTVQRWVQTWEQRGWPRVKRETCRGNSRGRLCVDAGDYARWRVYGSAGAPEPTREAA